MPPDVAEGQGLGRNERHRVMVRAVRLAGHGRLAAAEGIGALAIDRPSALLGIADNERLHGVGVQRNQAASETTRHGFCGAVARCRPVPTFSAAVRIGLGSGGVLGARLI